MDAQQTRRAGDVLKALGEEWRELVAGREGFLTNPKRAGLLRRRVVWGEMDSMVRENSVLCFLGFIMQENSYEGGELYSDSVANRWRRDM